MAVQTKHSDILADENRGKREQIIEMLTLAYWMEIETVINYVATDQPRRRPCWWRLSRPSPTTSKRSSGHAPQVRRPVSRSYVVPGSLGFHPEQHSLQPPRRADRHRPRDQGRHRRS